MALQTKKDFAGMCGMETRKLSIYIGRGNVVVTGEGYINDTDEKNRLFLEKHQSKKTGVGEDKKSNKSKVVKLKPTAPINETEDLPIDTGNKPLYQIEREKKLADLEKTKAETVYKELQIQKMKGQNIPTELVKNVVSILSKSLISAFKDGSDLMLIEISKRKQLSGNETAELKGLFVKIINEANIKAVNEANKGIKVIANDFSEKREVGEHD